MPVRVGIDREDGRFLYDAVKRGEPLERLQAFQSAPVACAS